MDEAILRLKLAADAGADVCFIEGVQCEQQLEMTVKALAPTPVSDGFVKEILQTNESVRFSSMSSQGV
jgi:2-methylisocitrate lyase-like PEP mutase family enzyme